MRSAKRKGQELSGKSHKRTGTENEGIENQYTEKRPVMCFTGR